MKTGPKRLPPDLPKALARIEALDGATMERLLEEEGLEAAHLVGITFEGIDLSRVAFRGCVFEKCCFPGDVDILYDWMDCAFRGCDFAGARLHKAAMLRVTLEDCRGVGTAMTEMTLRSVLLKACQLRYANYGLSRLTAVAFEGCDLSQASFGDAQFDGVTFTDCRLSGAELYGTRLKGMDLRSNAIDGIVLGNRGELEGATVTPVQACELARLLGVIID